MGDDVLGISHIRLDSTGRAYVHTIMDIAEAVIMLHTMAQIMQRPSDKVLSML